MMKIWNGLELLLIGVLGAAALTVGTAQVIGRYVNKNFAFINGEEVVVYLTVWAVFLASSQLVRTDGHVRPDVVLRLLPPQGQRWVEAFNCCVAILFCGGLAYCGFQVAYVARSLDERSITGLEFPMWIYYSAILTGAVLMLLRCVIKLYLLVFRFDPATMVIAVHDH
ncbi:TRAP-type C4-dicarboxylate transport system permease small subunit [Bradyrhizobium sp. USDA 4532]|uniref:TRAP transporter small permease n=1 Tax=unclassified Bradyrhizobium TaxID=2631580 RepID=UPI0020A030F9|nr:MULTISPECIES: TRAP transporter small permease [unclassified Bradyrhizobium]MCP1830357.1 TRAP-type C4-dicarboxylate transport system permease small subunit [Bradyrhizobium sp. USDA 4545]MCP1923466.1 TRAP-type C4-dicarboxylate transport system permease small subunit [Bradyrhizobium sp. USDA 4532]